MQLRVLLVNTGLYPVPTERGGGVELHTYHLARSLARLGVNVSYITDVTNGSDFPDNVTLRKINALRFDPNNSFVAQVTKVIVNGLKLFQVARKELNENEYDIIHIHDVRGNLPGLLIDKIRGDTPLVFTMHGPTPFMVTYTSWFEQKFREMAYKRFDMHLLKRADYVVVVANVLRDEVVQLGIPKERISVIPNGVDTEIFKRSERNSYVVKEIFGIERNYCIFVGQLIPRKQVHFLINAFKSVKADIGCVIVGEGSEYRRLRRLINALDLQDRVKLLGAVSLKALVSLYASASLFVLPSVAEGLPLAVLEAIACGLPVIACDVGGLSDVVIDKYNGFLVKPWDVKRLSTLIDLLGNDSRLREEMSNNAYEFTGKSFRWELVAKKYVEIYNTFS